MSKRSRRSQTTRAHPAPTVQEERPHAEEHWVTIALVALVAVGAGLRVLLLSGVDPAFVSFPDAGWYIVAARQDLFLNAVTPGTYPWPAGYSIFLAFTHLFADQLSFTILVQHLLGIATALLLFASVRRVVSPGWALLPAAVVLLAGPQIFLEHAPMAEALFTFLIAGLIYSCVRASDGRPLHWGFLAGVLAAAAGCVRLSGLTLIGVVVVWLALGLRGPRRPRLIAAGAATLGACLVLGAYLGEMKRETGYGGPALTRAGSYGVPIGASRPLDFVSDLPRFWSSDLSRNNGGLSYDSSMSVLVGGDRPSEVRIDALKWYSTGALDVDAGTFDALSGYERRTRLEGLPFVLLLALALGGMPLARGRRLALGLLVLAVALTTLLTPVLFARFDARYVVPGYGSLAAAGAIGAALLWERHAARLTSLAARRRTTAPRAKAQA